MLIMNCAYGEKKTSFRKMLDERLHIPNLKSISVVALLERTILISSG